MMVAALSAACASSPDLPDGRAEVTRAEMRSPAASLRTVMRNPDGEAEELPNDKVPVGAIVDEATPSALGPERVCLDVVVRNEAIYDQTFEQMGPKCIADGIEADVEVSPREPLTEHYPYDVRKGLLLGFTYVGEMESVPHQFDVITRRATICCEHPARHTLQLELTNRLMGEAPPGRYYRARFEWRITP
jgi:hypothetical protein